mmetsp:Transcript_141429/g.368351  ORF Transcript_141429/g.368351 Transcript_141429/m.368351 type:complete len:169 (-) Transcript_141429:1481-1987(-)
MGAAPPGSGAAVATGVVQAGAAHCTDAVPVSAALDSLETPPMPQGTAAVEHEIDRVVAAATTAELPPRGSCGAAAVATAAWAVGAVANGVAVRGGRRRDQPPPVPSDAVAMLRFPESLSVLGVTATEAGCSFMVFVMAFERSRQFSTARSALRRSSCETFASAAWSRS